MADRDRWLVRPGASFDLSTVDTRSTDGAPGDKHETEATFDELWQRLGELQERLYAESSRSVLVVLQAMDAGGKDGTIRHVFRGLNPLGVRVRAFKAPTEEELDHDFLWRVHQHAPRDGELAVFNRSHYEDVLVVRVHGLVPEDEWRRRYGHIRAFESLLADAGTTVVKVMLHISEDEQRERLQARVDDPTKRWKFNPGDLDERRRWDDYQAAFEEALRETSTDEAPWYCVPADRKWYRNWAVANLLLAHFDDLKLAYPDVDLDVAHLRSVLDGADSPAYARTELGKQ
jgi:PPK2 family polyphosphate:nucleotide phosphotransferase